MKLEKNLIYYHNLLINHGLKLDCCCITRDVYYTKENLDGMSENEMKNACIRIRYFQKLNSEETDISEKQKEEDKLIDDGYKKVFDTEKLDFQYSNNNMKSKIQIQDIKDLGLVLYYDNPDYYDLSLEEQRKCLFDELNCYGFNFKESDLGIDKLRSLYYGKEMFSNNQNG